MLIAGYGYARGVSPIECVQDTPDTSRISDSNRQKLHPGSASNFKTSKLRNGRYLTLCTDKFRDPSTLTCMDYDNFHVETLRTIRPAKGNYKFSCVYEILKREKVYEILKRDRFSDILIINFEALG